MQIGYIAWAAGWISFTIVLTVVAAALGPGPTGPERESTLMIRLHGGAFTMGSEYDFWDARPAHIVELQAFEMDQLPVVNAQFAAFLNEIGSVQGEQGLLYDLTDPAAKIARINGQFVAVKGYERHPVVAETWQGARAFCAWRGARLPTEAEWERAARGLLGRTYPWGDEPPDATRARYGVRLFDYVQVGSYPAGATPDGLLDMAGNVWQWTSSLYWPYPYRADDGREDPNVSGERVSRGGGQTAGPDMLRTTYRNAGLSQIPPSGRPPITFRCARDAA